MNNFQYFISHRSPFAQSVISVSLHAKVSGHSLSYEKSA